jgi:hypothetical protein
MRFTSLATLAAFTLIAFVVQPQAGQRNTARPAASRPAPRWPDGRVNFGPLPGENGLWNAQAAQLAQPDVPSDFGLFAVREGVETDPFLLAKPKLSQIPFQPWARALFADRVQYRFEPYTRCKPSAGARQVATAYGTQFLDVPELSRFYVILTGGAHSYRTVFMDGRPHPKNLSPTYYGHSVGHWEGDALVVDSVGFNERMWIDNLGMPTTEQLHLIERYTRTDFNTMKYEITVDDPGAYTATWKSGFYLRWTPGVESFEYVCQDNNHAPELLVGSGTAVDRSSPFVP